MAMRRCAGSDGGVEDFADLLGDRLESEWFVDQMDLVVEDTMGREDVRRVEVRVVVAVAEPEIDLVPEVRPPVLRVDTGAALAEYLGFRHLVRNLYTWDFAPQKIRQLVEQLPPTMEAVEFDFKQLAAFLEVAARTGGEKAGTDESAD